ncbi:MAG: 16S rRNA (cytosine(1402)-N(4))-methyltransferase, partial [Armatimonadota bacterium]
VVLRRLHFKDAAQVVEEFGVSAPLLGALWDLGLSSDQINRGEGFSFRDLDSPLSMRQDPDQELTASEVVNLTDEKDLADLIYRNSDERMSRRIAASIVRLRPLASVGDLVEAVTKSLPRGYRNRDDVLRRTLQAIRMEVNEELPQLTRSLGDILERMAPGGRMVVLSYHSGEDGLTKRFFRQAKLDGKVRILTPKPLRPMPDEVRDNPRARPAHLRAVEVIG